MMSVFCLRGIITGENDFLIEDVYKRPREVRFAFTVFRIQMFYFNKKKG